MLDEGRELEVFLVRLTVQGDYGLGPVRQDVRVVLVALRPLVEVVDLAAELLARVVRAVPAVPGVVPLKSLVGLVKPFRGSYLAPSERSGVGPPRRAKDGTAKLSSQERDP